MTNKIISFLVNIDYHNEKLDTIISKNDIMLNEQIINYGILIYEYIQNKTLDNTETEKFQERVQNIKDSLEKDYKNSS